MESRRRFDTDTLGAEEPRRNTTAGDVRPHMRPRGWAMGSGVTTRTRGLLRLRLVAALSAGDDGRLAGWSDGRRKMSFRRSSTVSLGADRCRLRRRLLPLPVDGRSSSSLVVPPASCRWASRRASASMSTSSASACTRSGSSSSGWSWADRLRPLRFLGVVDRLRLPLLVLRRVWSRRRTCTAAGSNSSSSLAFPRPAAPRFVVVDVPLRHRDSDSRSRFIAMVDGCGAGRSLAMGSRQLMGKASQAR